MAALRHVYAGASIVWAAALPLATFAGHRIASPIVYLLTFAVYAIGSVVCHQRPERSFFLWAHQMPVCARCTGIYAGAALGAMVFAFRRAGALRHNLGHGFSPARMALALGALPTVATLVYEWTTGHMPSNTVRALAGLPLGAAVSWIVIR
jgi:uncharacterized membrane protein